VRCFLCEMKQRISAEILFWAEKSDFIEKMS
jgi:hypothetical protein